MLNSGVDYYFSSKCYIKELVNKDNVKKFSIVNSPVIAPSKCSFKNQHTYLSDLALRGVIEHGIVEKGYSDLKV